MIPEQLVEVTIRNFGQYYKDLGYENVKQGNKLMVPVSRLQKNSKINPENFPRRRCGVIGGYQLDHIVSIKKGFEDGISPENMSLRENLRMLSWQENRKKHDK
jgi:5-methylcytosine-specific restriction endonuclease McrA